MDAFDVRLVSLILVTSVCMGQDAWPSDMRKVDIRPIEITIIDADTDKPIENLQVYYAVDAYMQKRKRVGFIFPNLETRGASRFLVKEKEFSDKDGKVYFHATNLPVSENEIVEHEFVYINIDIDMSHPDVKLILSAKGTESDNLDILKDELLTYDPGKKFVFNPNPAYAGFYLMSTYRSQGAGDCGSLLWDIVDYKCVGEGLAKSREEITVRLRKVRH